MQMLLLLLLVVVSVECGDAARYYVYGPPLVRRSPMEALERLRTPHLERYFPQVDYPEDDYSVYALSPQYTQNEEYDAMAYSPRQDEEAYNDLMQNYLMEQRPMQRRSGPTPPSPPPTTSQASVVSGVPPSPEKKSVQSLVVPDPPTSQQEVAGGRKEEPLFRPPVHNSQVEWQKSPLLKMISQKKADPLLEELSSLKKKA